MADFVQRYQELIGQLRWDVEIRRMDILLETSLSLSYLAMSQVGQLEQPFHILGYLKSHSKRKLILTGHILPSMKTGSISVTGWSFIGTLRMRSQGICQLQEATLCRRIVLLTRIMLVTMRREDLRPSYCCFATVRQ